MTSTSIGDGVASTTFAVNKPLPLNLSLVVVVVAAAADVATLQLLLPLLSPACEAVTFVRHSLGSLLITISAIAAAVAPNVAASAAEQTVPLPAVVVDEDVEEEGDDEMVEPGRADTGVVLVETMTGEEIDRTAADSVVNTVPEADSLGSSECGPEPLDDDRAVLDDLNLTSGSEWSTSRSLMSSKN